MEENGIFMGFWRFYGHGIRRRFSRGLRYLKFRTWNIVCGIYCPYSRIREASIAECTIIRIVQYQFLIPFSIRIVQTVIDREMTWCYSTFHNKALLVRAWADIEIA